jgi:hypothetical protein
VFERPFLSPALRASIEREISPEAGVHRPTRIDVPDVEQLLTPGAA